MASNPTSRLEEILPGCFPAVDERDLMNIPCFFPSGPQPWINSKIEYLQYMRYQPFVGQYSFATIQECETQEEAERQWETQRKYDEGFLIHPESCKINDGTGKYVLVFPKILRLFKVWVQEHAKGQVTDADIWKLLKKIIGKNMIYLVESNRPHGNLLEGIAVTPESQPLFLNLSADTDALIFGRDAQAVIKIHTAVESKLRTKYIKDDINKWINFLNMICSAHSGPSPRFLPHDYNAVHARFVFNYPISWDVEKKLWFLRNMYYLCKDRRDNQMYNLMKDVEFRKSLQVHYADWPAKVTSVSGTSGQTALREVYQFGVSIGLYVKQGKKTSLTLPSIVLFAHNCIKHHRKNVQKYNKKHGTNLKMLTEPEILAVLYTLYPYLIEHIYEAFYMAVTYGHYFHFTFTTAKILTGNLLF